ncbi:MAG TPA: 6-carboxytetrahydropterin synthase QueD [Firmicutes bacterium]|nr:6-carboxytetrahydropterin synthase QueD [Bacillota bacterium]HAX00894.1 6-carboxytetrahydropterin synthase QueD [Bacillota bacterium]
MHLITSESSFDAAHFLTNYEGKCKNIHGHRWRVVVTIKGELTNGMLVDFGDFKKDIKDLCDYFDHSFIVEKGSLDKKLFDLLNEQFVLRVVEFRTTAENFSKYIFEEMSKKYSVKEVCVYETPNNCARYVCE